ncbi:MAG: hypothetical protein K2X41_00765, partial [Hyphomicrobium sp.]|nr:hypothetical protein [Hyphomicrobium sp.]
IGCFSDEPGRALFRYGANQLDEQQRSQNTISDFQGQKVFSSFALDVAKRSTNAQTQRRISA